MKVHRRSAGLLMLLTCLVLASCSNTDSSKVVTGKGYYSSATDDTEAGSSEEQKENNSNAEEYLLEGYNTEAGLVYFKKLNSGKEEQYAYTDGTFFLNKYGELVSMSAMEPGAIVSYQVDEKTQKLLVVQVSAIAWCSEGVSDYNIDEDRGVISFGEANYSYDEKLLVYSGDDQIHLTDVGTGNSLRITGEDKKIYSIAITTGTGSITLQNTELFQGGWLNLDNRTYLKITDGMKIDVEEGKHILTVANDGYGDSAEIEVKRGENLAVDLNTLKGEGPKYCDLQFDVTLEDTEVFLDGEKVDISGPVQIKYGTHVLQAKAEGYGTWTRRLVVNSAKAVIEIDLSGEAGTQSEETTEASSEKSSEKSTEKSSEKSSETIAGSTGTTDSTTSDAYLKALSGIMDTLTSTSSN